MQIGFENVRSIQMKFYFYWAIKVKYDHRSLLVLQDTSPMRSKSKYEKFHKLFKTVPPEEYPLNGKVFFNLSMFGDACQFVYHHDMFTIYTLCSFL